MKPFVVALAIGILVGLIYGLLHVRSPAPPVVALAGLLGMLIGEQIVPLASRLINGEGVTTAWFVKECIPKITGALPAEADPPVDAERSEVRE